MTEYPSIAAVLPGQLLGRLYECVPIRVLGMGPSLSHVFALLTAPIGVLLYALQKLFGHRYVLTNRSVQVWASRTSRLISSISLDDFDHLELRQGPGQVFFKAHDILFIASSGKTVMTLSGVKDAGSFRNAIQGAADARRLVKQSMDRIAARV